MPNRTVTSSTGGRSSNDRHVPDSNVNYGNYSYAALLAEARRAGLEYSTEFSRLTDEYIATDNANERKYILAAIAAFLTAGVAVGGIGAGAASGAAGTSGSGVSISSATGNDVIGTASNAGNTGQIVSNLLGDSQSSSTLSNIWNHLSGVGSSLLSGISQLGTGIIGQFASSTLNYENQKKLIDAQNAYNTPAAQMQRFAEAGLNPNLIYGLGSNGNQPASGAVAPVDFDTSQREARLAKMNIETQTKLANADAAQKMSAAKLNETQNGLVDEQRKSAMMQNQVWLENYQADLNLKLQEKDNLIAEQRRMLAEARSSEIKNQYSDRIYQLEVEKSQLEKEISQIQRNWQPYLNAGQIFGNVVGGFRDFGLGLGSILRGRRRPARSSN